MYVVLSVHHCVVLIVCVEMQTLNIMQGCIHVIKGKFHGAFPGTNPNHGLYNTAPPSQGQGPALTL